MRWKQLESFTAVTPCLVTWTFLVHCALSVFVNQVFFGYNLGDSLENGSRGLLNSTFQANLLLMAATLPLLVVAGKQRWREFWLDRLCWRRAVCWLVGLVLLYQLCVIALGGWEAVRISEDWIDGNACASTGRVLAQLFGNALYEELLFRAFFLTQFFLQLRARKWSNATSLVIAIIASQALFAIMHIPNRLYKGSYDSIAGIIFDQSALFLFGLYYAIVLMAFRTLTVPVILHAFWNAPPAVLSSGADDWSVDTTLNVFRLFTLLVVMVGAVYSVRRSRNASKSRT
ncbi:MAG: CPBP family intramembrane glutamic endopeptidase [Pirellulaceae bacterium]